MIFLELAERVLLEAKAPLTVVQIWNAAVAKGYDKELRTSGKTPWATLGAQLYMSVKDDSKSIFARTESRPKKFYLKSMANCIALDDNTIPEDIVYTKDRKINFLEKDLHKYLTYYAYVHSQIYTKTINHSKSSKKEFGEWVHPDMVGCHFRMENWDKEVYDFSNSIGVRGIWLYSYEIKRELSFSNLRESFFQCVSNSSWANESYLVAAHISENEDFRDELERLASSFCIGVIQLNLDEPDASEVIIMAKDKKDLDFEAINKLSMNKDFKEFLERIKIDLDSKKIHKTEYDNVEKLEELMMSSKS